MDFQAEHGLDRSILSLMWDIGPSDLLLSEDILCDKSSEDKLSYSDESLFLLDMPSLEEQHHETPSRNDFKDFKSTSMHQVLPQNAKDEPRSKVFKPFHQDRWSDRLQELRNYCVQNGQCLVPHTYPPNPQLARWVKRQRRQYKLMLERQPSNMTFGRIERLEQLGFVWDSHDASWKEKFEELRRYHIKYGHSAVPSKCSENPKLATWVKCQRRQYKLFIEGKQSGMNATRVEELHQLGFKWKIARSAKKQPAKYLKDYFGHQPLQPRDA